MEAQEGLLQVMTILKVRLFLRTDSVEDRLAQKTLESLCDIARVVVVLTFLWLSVGAKQRQCQRKRYGYKDCRTPYYDFAGLLVFLLPLMLTTHYALLPFHVRCGVVDLLVLQRPKKTSNDNPFATLTDETCIIRMRR